MQVDEHACRLVGTHVGTGMAGGWHASVGGGRRQHAHVRGLRPLDTTTKYIVEYNAYNSMSL